ncbi:MAG: glycosyltransferase [Parcubacteria group bacterium]
MKILHYIKSFSKPSETFVYDQIINLENEGIDNYILTQNRELKKERPFNEDKVCIFKERNRYLLEKLLHKIFYWKKYHLRKEKDAKKIIEKIKPDIIHAHFGYNGIFIKKLLKKYKLNIPLVIAFHGTDITSRPALDFAYRQEIKKLKTYRNSIYTAHSFFLKNKMIQYKIPKNKIEIINNTFNKNFLGTRKKNIFKKSDEFKIINIGRFVNVKGQKYLIKAFSKLLKNDYQNASLTFVGDGETKKEIEKLASDLRVRDKINFLGVIDHNKIPKILKQQSVYIQPSIKDMKTFQEESFGVSILEAIIIGLPVIVTNTGGMPETVIEDNQQFSFIVPEKDSEAIYKILKYMVSNKYKFKDNSDYSQKIIKKFSPEKNTNSIINIYKKLLK